MTSSEAPEDLPAGLLIPRRMRSPIDVVVAGLQQCAALSRDRSRRVVLRFTNAWATSEPKAIKSNRQNFSDQLKIICRRIEEINRPLLELLHEVPS